MSEGIAHLPAPSVEDIERCRRLFHVAQQAQGAERQAEQVLAEARCVRARAYADYEQAKAQCFPWETRYRLGHEAMQS